MGRLDPPEAYTSKHISLRLPTRLEDSFTPANRRVSHAIATALADRIDAKRAFLIEPQQEEGHPHPRPLDSGIILTGYIHRKGKLLARPIHLRLCDFNQGIVEGIPGFQIFSRKGRREQ